MMISMIADSMPFCLYTFYNIRCTLKKMSHNKKCRFCIMLF